MESIILGSMAAYVLYLFSLEEKKRNEVFEMHSKILLAGMAVFVVLGCLFKGGCDCSGGGSRYSDF